jgi:TolA-binding protein
MAYMQGRRRISPISLVAAGVVSLLIAACRQPATEEFHNARKRYLEGNYASAIMAMDGFGQANPGHKFLSRALLIKGKAAMGLRDWGAAQAAFEGLTRAYPGSLQADKARYKLAMLAELRGELQQARADYVRIAASRSVMRAEAAARAGLLDAVASRSGCD